MLVTKDTDSSKFLVYFPDTQELLCCLNKNLAIMQGLSLENLKFISHAHIYKKQLFIKMHEANNPSELQELASKVTDTEFLLQDLWGFPKNAHFHKFWLLPQCDCPKTDNEDRYGTAYAIYSTTCPIHSYIK